MMGVKKSGEGPGFYMLPSTIGSGGPSWSLGRPFRREGSKTQQGPGPQSYSTSHLTRKGPSTVTACKLGARFQHGSWYPQTRELPGPGSYSPELYGSIQHRCAPRDSPTPSQHSLASRETRYRRRSIKSSTPGPGSYDVTPLDSYKTRQPTFKMAPSVYNSCF